MSYQECLEYLEMMGIHLFDYQKEMLKAFMAGQKVRSARGVGRSYVLDAWAECVKRAIKEKYDLNNYDEEPDLVIPYEKAIEANILTQESIDSIKKIMTEECFKKEFVSEKDI